MNAAKLERTIHGTREALEGKIDSLIAAQTARAAVETDREKRSSNGFTRFQTWALYLGVLAAILAPFISHWLS